MLWLLLSLLPTVFPLTCNKCIINELYNDKECSSSCNGTACWVTEYNFQYPQYKGIRAFEMGCLAAPVSFPLGCRYNQAETYMCICDQEYCNTKELVINRTSLTVPKMQTCTDLLFYNKAGKCTALICYSENNGIPMQGCMERKTQHDLIPGSNFDLFYTDIYGFVWPAKSCLLIHTQNSVDGKCTTSKQIKPEEMPNFIGNLTCRKSYKDREETCSNATLCFTARAYNKVELLGCLQQTNVQGMKFIPGAYQFFDSYIFLCNTSLCNNGIDAHGKPRNITMEQLEGNFDTSVSNPSEWDQNCCTQPPPVVGTKGNT